MIEYIKVYQNFLPDKEYTSLACSIKQLHDRICVDDNCSYEYETIMRSRKIDKLSNEVSFYKPYLKKIINPDCNMFFQDVIFLRENKNGIPVHIDSQLKDRMSAIEADISYTPICVNVFYVNVPDDFKGGELVIGNTSIVPTNNTLVEFSSNLSHYVKPFYTNSRRCMLVTEQCKFDKHALVLHGSKIEIPFTNNQIKKDRYGNFE